jgi:hypothetical protein
MFNYYNHILQFQSYCVESKRIFTSEITKNSYCLTDLLLLLMFYSSEKQHVLDKALVQVHLLIVHCHMVRLVEH